jgi:hypothetical protein
MGGVKRTKTCIASEFSDALDAVGRLLSVLGRCGRARSGGGRCRRCRGCRGCCRRLRGLVSVLRTSALSRATSISLSIGLCLLEGMTLVCAVSRLLTEVAGHSRTTMTSGRRCE